ncbi:fumarylacetoacetate hydrolase family protein [Anaerobacillus sp. MEB173]|uniref:fumarylacetoacetate hydrolase family protein n=1 Tax=Anaerobacillus sp. MEB173 TaxID=3383345 RepID=UPI003F90D6ED
MRFVTFLYDQYETYGIINDSYDEIIDVRKAQWFMSKEAILPSSLLAGIKEGDVFLNMVNQVVQWAKENVDEQYIYEITNPNIKLLAPIPRPAKNIFCVGKNYAAHAIEMGSAADIPEYPMIFSKAPTTVIGHESIMLNHKEVTDSLDYEGELAVIIGKKGKAIKKEEAFDYVFGYTIINDVTARDLQKKHKQFLIGKSLDTSCPMGPYITHRSVVDDPHQLAIETKVNGESRQVGNTEQFIFDIPTIIATISQGMTLEAGDIIATGTPAGVGSGFNPPKYLQPGDVIEITVERLGTLRNQLSID